MQREDANTGDQMATGIKTPTSQEFRNIVKGVWQLQVHDADGNLVHEDEWENLVVDEGLNELLDTALNGTTPVSDWYIGLTDQSPSPAAGDTMGSHAGWTEITAYDESARQLWDSGTVSNQQISNSSNPATFTISSNSTGLGGAFLTSDNTKGGTAGKLYAIGSFTGGDIVLNDGSTVTVTATFTTAAA